MAHKPPPPKNLRRKPEPPKPASKESKSKKLAPPVKAASSAKDAKGKEAKKEAKPAAAKPTAGKPVAAKAGAKAAAAKGAVAAKDAPPKKKRSKSGGVRLKAYWGVFNQMMKRIALFEYAERKQADKKAAELGAGGKTPHFVQLVKEVIRDAD